MRAALALGLAGTLFVCSMADAARHRHDPPPTAGKFDYYVLSLSWAPEYCKSHADDQQECGAEKPGFVLHGLWPQYTNGGYPDTCSVSTQLSEDDRTYAKTVFPSEKLVVHEWQKHGTCSGLSPREYFEAAESAYKSVSIPPLLQPGTNVRTTSWAAISKALRDANSGMTNKSVAVICSGQELSEVRLCLGKDLKPMSCGSGVRTSCGNNVKVLGAQ